MLLFSSGLIDHVITILTTCLFIVVGKKPSAQCNGQWAEPKFTWENIILNDILALGFDLDIKNNYQTLVYNNFLLKKRINFISFDLFLTGPCSCVLVRCRPLQSPIFLLNDYKKREKSHHLIGQWSNYGDHSSELFFMK